MPSFPRILLVSFQTAALALFVLLGSSMTVLPATASPLPFPMPIPVPMMMSHMDYSQSPPANSSTHSAKPQDAAARLHDLHQTAPVTSGEMAPRDVTATNGNFGLLSTYYTQIIENGSKFHTLAGQASSRSSDPSYHQEMTAQAHTFHIDLLGFRSVLQQLGADKGLANYNQDDQMETMLKDVVNSTKYFLEDLDQAVYQIPVLGDTLGPIVYEIKCILDEVLDTLENVTDAVLNAVQPLVQSAIDTASKILGAR